MKKEQQTIKAIQEAVPEIMEVKNNCYCQQGNLEPFMILGIFEDKVFIQDFSAGCPIVTTTEQYIYGEEVKILGRPITLEDVLVAGNKIGAFYEEGKMCDCMIEKLIFNNWQLNKPFSEQSQEIKDFIHSLLCK